MRWELSRLCRDYIKMHGGDWEKRKTFEVDKKERKEKEDEKKARFKKIEEKKSVLKRKVQTKEIEDKLQKLEREGEDTRIFRQEEDNRRKELKEFKTNLWKKHGRENQDIRREDIRDLEEILKEISRLENEIEIRKKKREEKRILEKEAQKIKAKKKKEKFLEEYWRKRGRESVKDNIEESWIVLEENTEMIEKIMLAVQEFEDCKQVGGKGDQGGLQLRGKHEGGHHGSSGGDQDGRDGGWGEVHHEENECEDDMPFYQGESRVDMGLRGLGETMITWEQSATEEDDQGGLQLQGIHHGHAGDDQDGQDSGRGKVHHGEDECEDNMSFYQGESMVDMGLTGVGETMLTTVQSATREEDQGGLQLCVDHHGGHHGSAGDDQDGRDGGWGKVHQENMSNLNPPSPMFNINLGTVVESEMRNELMEHYKDLNEKRKRKFEEDDMEENVGRYSKRFKIVRENSNLQKPIENTNLQKPSTKKQIFNLQQSELVIDVETPVDPNIVTRRNIRNDVVDFDVETVIGSSRLEMLSLKEKSRSLVEGKMPKRMNIL